MQGCHGPSPPLSLATFTTRRRPTHIAGAIPPGRWVLTQKGPSSSRAPGLRRRGDSSPPGTRCRRRHRWRHGGSSPRGRASHHGTGVPAPDDREGYLRHGIQELDRPEGEGLLLEDHGRPASPAVGPMMGLPPCWLAYPGRYPGITPVTSFRPPVSFSAP
jgi:hypothetical protein